MTEVRDFDATAANNTGASADGWLSEGVDYFEVNNAYRELQAIMARLYADNNGSLDTTGSANAYVLAAAQTISALTRGDVFWFEANFTCTGAATLNVDAVGAVAIVKNNGNALISGEIISGGVYVVQYDGTSFLLLNDASMDINGLTADTAVGATDTIPIYDGTNKKITFANFEGDINHDSLTGFVADEHVAHAGVTITAGAGLAGGGTIAATRTLDVGAGNGIAVDADTVGLDTSHVRNVSHSGVSIVSGAGTVGGGTLESTRTLDIVNATNGGLQINANDMQLDIDDLAAATPVAADEVAFDDAGTSKKATFTVLGTLLESLVDHDNLVGFVAGEHILHSGVSVVAGTGLTGGGAIDATLTLNVGAGTGILANANDVALDTAHDRNVLHAGVTVTAGAGLTGGGPIDATLTLDVANAINGGIQVNANDIQMDIDNLTVATPVGADDIAFDDAGVTKKATITNFVLAIDSLISHDNLGSIPANDHIDHSTVSVVAGTGLTGGGTIAANRTVNVIGAAGITANANDIEVDFSGETNIAIAATQPTDSLAINDGGVLKQIDIQDMGLRVVNLSTAQTFALGDANTYQNLTGATTRDWTIPPNSSVDFGIGAVIYGGSETTAVLGIDPGAGVTLTSRKATGTSTQDIKAGGSFFIIQVGTDIWKLGGDLV